MYLELQLVNEYERGPGSSGEREKAPGMDLWPFDPYRDMISEVVSRCEGRPLRSSRKCRLSGASMLMVLAKTLPPELALG